MFPNPARARAAFLASEALADVWPVWYHCAFVCCPAELSIEEACLPTHCFAVVLLNLAETYAKAGQWRLCQRTLAQGLFWFRRMLQQSADQGKFAVAANNLAREAGLSLAQAGFAYLLGKGNNFLAIQVGVCGSAFPQTIGFIRKAYMQ